jgi:hypothetical protein
LLKHVHETAAVEITSQLPLPIALNIGGNQRFVTLCRILLRYNGYELVIPAGYEFDGPTIPRLLWWIVGLSPADLDALLASLFHDFILDTRVLDRIVGDAIFCVCLGPVVFNEKVLPGVGPKRRAAMYLAVRSWSIASGADTLWSTSG